MSLVRCFSSTQSPNHRWLSGAESLSCYVCDITSKLLTNELLEANAGHCWRAGVRLDIAVTLIIWHFLSVAVVVLLYNVTQRLTAHIYASSCHNDTLLRLISRAQVNGNRLVRYHPVFAQVVLTEYHRIARHYFTLVWSVYFVQKLH